jgi:hypothetical protein
METQETFEVVRHWYNGFAEDCYQLADGRTVYINYKQDTLRIVTKAPTKEHYEFNMTAEEKLAETL